MLSLLTTLVMNTLMHINVLIEVVLLTMSYKCAIPSI